MCFNEQINTHSIGWIKKYLGKYKLKHLLFDFHVLLNSTFMSILLSSVPLGHISQFSLFLFQWVLQMSLLSWKLALADILSDPVFLPGRRRRCCSSCCWPRVQQLNHFSPSVSLSRCHCLNYWSEPTVVFSYTFQLSFYLFSKCLR